jgi:hypothetical protein
MLGLSLESWLSELSGKTASEDAVYDPRVPDSLTPIAQTSLLQIYRAFGRSPVVSSLFEMYGELKDVFDAEQAGLLPGDRDFYTRFLRAVGVLDSRITSETTRSRVEQKSQEILPILRRIDGGQELPLALWKTLVESYADLIQSLSADKDVFLVTRKLPGSSPVRWLRLQKTSPKEQEIERIRRDDPDLFERLQMDRAQRNEIGDSIRKRIAQDGKVASIRSVFGRPVNIGTDPVTGEASVYDTDGEVIPLAEFGGKIKSKNKAMREVINPHWKTGTIEKLRAYSDEEVERIAASSPTRYVSLTDDPNKDTVLTKIYRVADIQGVPVVVAGRYRGIPVPSLVNAAGRQIEGSAYYLDYDTNTKITRRDTKNADGSLSVRRTREPYVTVHQGKLFLQVSGEHYFTGIRNEMSKLAGKVPTIQAVPGTRKSGYVFETKDFNIIRDRVGSMALSSAASKLLQGYFEELAKADRAAGAENLERFSSDRLGLKLPLRRHTMRALAWMEANGDKGICALDTGMGKTVTAIASMMNLDMRGKAEGTNGRYLYVCEKDLLGNLVGEFYKFLDKEIADEVASRVDIIPYTKFVSFRKKDPAYGDDYIAIYFDEAHLRLGSKSKAAYKAAVGCKAKHKILLTASPMVKDPKEVFTLASVANSLDLNSPEGRRQEANFLGFYTQDVGGRPVSVTRDPNAAKDFRVWVKRNLFFADKTSVAEEDSRLEQLRKETVAVTMPPELEDAYKREMQNVLGGLQDLLAVYKERPELAFEAASRRVKRPLANLTRLSDVPNRVIPGLPNPKINRAVEIINQIPMGDRVLLFSDSTELAEDTFSDMQEKFPGKGHVLGLTNAILYCSPTGEILKFTARKYRDPDTGRLVKADEWKTFILTKVLGLGLTHTQYPVHTAVLTGSYAVGQNLQSFGHVIHLDRDGWSNETMKQRTARAWRSGNKKPVDEYTVDLTYGDQFAGPDAAQTLDEIRRVVQGIDDSLFNQVVADSQVERLGEEWTSIKKQRSLLHKVNRRMLERALSPYAQQLGEQETEV